MLKKCDIIIPVWNELESTRECIDRLKSCTRYPYRLIIIDNASREPAKGYLENLKNDFPDMLLIRNNSNLGFVKAVNQGISACNDQYILVLNNDAYVRDRWLTALIETVESAPKNIGIVNPTSNVFGKTSCDGNRGEWQELDSCKGFCMLIKREVTEKIGLFDEIYGIGYFEEKDFSRRAKNAGFLCIRSKASFVFHRDKLSFDKVKARDEIFERNEKIYNKRWGKPLNIAFTEKKGDLTASKNLIYEFLDKGHRAHIFFPKGKKLPLLKDHIQIRYFPVSGLFFGYSILFKLWERRRKKKIELIISDDRSILDFFNRFKFIHKATVIDSVAVRAKGYL